MLLYVSGKIEYWSAECVMQNLVLSEQELTHDTFFDVIHVS